MPRLSVSLKKTALVLGAVFLFLTFASLCGWQLARLQWKLDLIERVEAKAYGPATHLPPASSWPLLDAATVEYQRVYLQGEFMPRYTVLTQAVTKYGLGYWVMTPMQVGNLGLVWVNRGFVTGGSPEQWSSLLSSMPQELIGLMRWTEPEGGYLRKNNVHDGRWYSRDVQALSAAMSLGDIGLPVAPFFVDASVQPSPVGGLNPATPAVRPSFSGDDTGEIKPLRHAPDDPIPGLTVLQFKNNHLQYAITWAILALMVLAAALWLRRSEA